MDIVVSSRVAVDFSLFSFFFELKCSFRVNVLTSLWSYDKVLWFYRTIRDTPNNRDLAC